MDLVEAAEQRRRRELPVLLPFCMVFASGDKLHARLVPHLKREDQEFVWEPDLRTALRELHAYYVARHVELGATGPEAFRSSHQLMSTTW